MIKEYIVASLASLIFNNFQGVDNNDKIPKDIESPKEQEYQVLKREFSFDDVSKQKSNIYKTAPTNWIKAK
jgi:hypothetical protein